MNAGVSAPLRVLYVNWVDYLDPERRGGGVSVYQRNVMRALEGRPDVEAAFLASGTSYDLIRRAPRWEGIRHGPDAARARRFDMVNAAPLGPGHFSFGDAHQISHPATEAAIVDLVAKTGPYDVVHFNNLEGVPVAVLPALRQAFPDLRIVLSLHNYYPICPQVNLWREERALCTDFEGGAACTNCLQEWHPASRLRMAQGLAYHLKCLGVRPKSRLWTWTFQASMALGRRASRLLGSFRRALPQRAPKTVPNVSPSGSADPSASLSGGGTPAIAFANRRRAMVEAINGACDHVLRVSAATRSVALS